jgi:predicted PurR-regulated permease PerM
MSLRTGADAARAAATPATPGSSDLVPGEEVHRSAPVGEAAVATRRGRAGTESGADGELVPVGVRAAAAWTWRILVIAGGIYLLLLLLAEFKVLVVPVLVALLVVALLRPLTDMGVGRLGLPRPLAAILTILFLLGVIAGLMALIGQQAITGLPDLQRQSTAGLADLQRILAESPLHLTADQLGTYVDRVQESVSQNSNRLVTGALGVASTAADVGSGLFIALFSIFFFLSSGDRIWGFVVRLFPRGARPRVQGAGVRAWATLTAFVRATVIVALVDAVGIGIGAAILGVPLAIPIAVLVFLGAFVPIIGALLTGIVAVLVALVSKGAVVALIMLAVVVAVQQLEAHVLQPFLLGRAVEVHPLAVILGIGAGVLVAGIIGALFAVPLVAVGHVVAEYLTSGEPEPEPGSAPGDPTSRSPEQDARIASEQAGPLADAATGGAHAAAAQSGAPGPVPGREA